VARFEFTRGGVVMTRKDVLELLAGALCGSASF
jgi:hypothetical protein